MDDLRRDIEAGRSVKVATVAKGANMAAGTLYQAIARGEVRAVRIGRSVRIPAKEAARLLGLEAA